MCHWYRFLMILIVYIHFGDSLWLTMRFPSQSRKGPALISLPKDSKGKSSTNGCIYICELASNNLSLFVAPINTSPIKNEWSKKNIFHIIINTSPIKTMLFFLSPSRTIEDSHRICNKSCDGKALSFGSRQVWMYLLSRPGAKFGSRKIGSRMMIYDL